MSTVTPWGPIGYITYKRTYARRLDDAGINTEEFKDTVERELSGILSQLQIPLTQEEQEFYRSMRLGLKGSVAGRFMWQLGTKTVDDLGLLSLQNCALTVVNEPIRPFTWTMDALMLGCGVGFNIQREYVYELPRVKRSVVITRKDTKDADFIVPDSREGWVDLLRRTLESHFITGKSFTFSTICIRPKGTPIKGFGGVASGPEELCWGIDEISKVLSGRAGKKVRPIDALDIMNIIGAVVVAGNVRRSAQIAIGDMDDLQFLNAKRWDLGNIPRWRAMSNNSVVCSDFSKLPDQFWQGYSGGGEPYGLINLNLSKSVGRTGDTKYPDPKVCGFNPCAEQSLADKETCCLAELYLPNIQSYAELIQVIKMLYRVCKHSLTLPCHHKETEKIVHKNMRMGIGVTGYLQCSEEKKSWLKDAYAELRKFDKQYSKEHGFPASVKLTTVKPSGTLSLLAGTTSGCHPGFSQYFIRRVRMSSDIPLVALCRKNGYPVEYQRNFDGSEDRNTVVVSFPCKHEEGTVLAKDMTAIAQLEVVKRLQAEWSDNAVSCTVYYRPEELADIKKWLSENYNVNIKACSFLLHRDHGFDQAPLEEITREQYEEASKKVKPINFIESIDEKKVGEVEECVNGVCPIK
jgi:ribonucleotide reductase alpha subunit